MSIFSKLFGKSKSKTSPKEIIPDKQMGITLDSIQSESFISLLLFYAVPKKLKKYKNVIKFIDNHSPINKYYEGTISIVVTEDIYKLFNTWNTLHYICTDERLNDIKDKVLAVTPSEGAENLIIVDGRF